MVRGVLSLPPTIDSKKGEQMELNQWKTVSTKPATKSYYLVTDTPIEWLKKYIGKIGLLVELEWYYEIPKGGKRYMRDPRWDGYILSFSDGYKDGFLLKELAYIADWEELEDK